MMNNNFKQCKIEDLLGRDFIPKDYSGLIKNFIGETILITGAAGSIGSALAKQLSSFNVKYLILIDQSESSLYDLQQDLLRNNKNNFIVIVADVVDDIRMKNIFNQYNPTMVFHVAAYKQIPLMEQFPYEAIKVNVNGTKLLANISSLFNVKKFVFISSDKAVNPTSVIGGTKRMAEMYISCIQEESTTKFITTRFGNVLGSNGSVIPLFKKQIEAGGPITLTHKDVTRYFMVISEAVQLVLEAGAKGQGGDIFMFDMGKPIKIYDLAKNLIKQLGGNFYKDIGIKIIGLRSGEKLHEELLIPGEKIISTHCKKINIYKAKKLDYSKVKSDIEKLCITNCFQNENIVAKMKQIIPEYKSNNYR